MAQDLFCSAYTVNMKRLSTGLPSLERAKRLLIVSQLGVGTLCARLKACQCFHQKDIFNAMNIIEFQEAQTSEHQEVSSKSSRKWM